MGKYFPFKISILFHLLILQFLFSANNIAQIAKPEEEVKSQFIFRLSEYFTWPNENKTQNFVIAIFDNESEIYPYLLSYAKSSRIKGKPVEILKIKGLNSLINLNVNVFYISKETSKNARRIYDLLKGRGIVLFSDECESIDETMINFILTKDKKISFEINKKNLEANKFKVPKELLVLGGSQLDIKAVFDESQKNLEIIQGKVNRLQSEIDNQNNVIKNQNFQIDNQKKTISQQYDEINRQNLIYQKLKSSIDSTQRILNNKSDTLSAQQANIDIQKGTIQEQKDKIKEQLAILEQQLNEITVGQKNIEEQKEALKQQDVKIGYQQNVIIFVLGFTIIFFIMIVMIWRSNRAKKKINKQLIEQNAQIEQQKEDLENQKRLLEISNKELESFGYSVSHDLRAPLRIIDGYSNILIDEYHDKLDNDARELLKKVSASSQKIARLIDDLLKLSRITRQNLIKDKINFSLISKSVVDELKTYNQDKKVEIIIQNNMEAEADPQLIRIALENLIGNSYKFTSFVSNPVIEIGSFKNDGKDVYFVKDNGAGFDMRYADKLFVAFHRLHSEAEFPGTGIGLSIVQRIIQRHGGAIWAESEIGKGSCFYFSLS